MVWFLIVSDILMLWASFWLAYVARTSPFFAHTLEVLPPMAVYLAALPYAAALLVSIFYVRGLYWPARRLTPTVEAYEVSKGVTAWALLVMSGSYLVKFDYSRIVVITTWLLALVLVTGGRWVASRIISILARRGVGALNVLIIGSGKPARIIANQLQPYARLGYRLVGCVGDGGINGLPWLGTVDDVPRLISAHGIRQVYVAEPALSYDAILTMVYTCPSKNVQFRIAANIFPRFHAPRSLTELEGFPSLDVRRAEPAPWYRAAKRLLDILLGSLLLISSLPLWGLIVFLIRRDSTGPAILTQPRVGYRGRRFILYKFRSMRADAERDATPPSSLQDSRITRVGRLLRRTSLDELPQLLNILRGDMSLVGPRPELESLAARYQGWQLRRFDAKPGLTGLWQILGRKDLSLEQKLEYDFYYVNNQSLLLDLMIMVRTIPQIIFGKGAY
ncbi:MAG: Exopolysaccharide biosynthesis polyprenyl glycosylphosphotransferase [Parcubacteria group bacterium Gr01-1014_31]|nr:MAG: Exopolysaccharide biosynthesis polyprenyl glycosylphosphotransferase [Parcubacteria group bacterium Gr01-1014_31]